MAGIEDNGSPFKPNMRKSKVLKMLKRRMEELSKDDEDSDGDSGDKKPPAKRRGPPRRSRKSYEQRMKESSAEGQEVNVEGNVTSSKGKKKQSARGPVNQRRKAFAEKSLRIERVTDILKDKDKAVSAIAQSNTPTPPVRELEVKHTSEQVSQ